MILDREEARRVATVRRSNRRDVADRSTESLVADIFDGWLNEIETKNMFRMVLNELTKRDVWYELLNPDLVTPEYFRQTWPRAER